MISNVFDPKKPLIFLCKDCDFSSCNKKDYNRHIQTKKHIFNVSQCFSIEKTQKNPYECNCGKIYKDNSGLWRHKKKCTSEKKEELDSDDNSQSNEIQELKEFMKYLMKENSEMKNMMMEVIKTGTHNTINTHTNSHNKTFNLQFFLNETCKDAMNIMDFVDSVKLQLSDLENVGKLGYVDGISNIIVKNLKALDVEKRPVHCTDSKREILYIKDEDKWEKENEENNKIKKVIKKIAYKNQRLLPEFKKEHPDCGNYHSKYSDQYNKIVVESLGGSGDNDDEKEDKIIKNLAKQVLIDKDKYSSFD
jgi:hypothetical protein